MSDVFGKNFYLRQGCLLETHITRGWSDERKEQGEWEENKRIFLNFKECDGGRSSILVAVVAQETNEDFVPAIIHAVKSHDKLVEELKDTNIEIKLELKNLKKISNENSKLQSQLKAKDKIIEIAIKKLNGVKSDKMEMIDRGNDDYDDCVVTWCSGCVRKTELAVEALSQIEAMKGGEK